jgi:hypothetical protein
MAAAVAAWLLTAATAQAAKPNEWGPIQDPHFGEVLFYFYQQKYFSSLTHLMAAQQLARVSHHPQEAELLRGGLLLSFGLHQEAGRIFEQLIDQGAPPAVRDRAWFYLAKIRYQRGYVDEAQDAVLRIGAKLPGELEEERQVLAAGLRMTKAEYREAIEILNQLSPKSDWGRYGRYNLGVALIKAGEREKGMDLLDQVGHDKARGEEQLALRDKANVALGYACLQSEYFDLARIYLERVRLDGLLANKALLGFGWAYAGQGQYEQALVPWQELKGRPLADSAVQESLLAVPFSLGKLGAHRRALQEYEGAIEIYLNEMGRLDGAIAHVQREGLASELFERTADDEMGWFWRLERLPENPESFYLLTLIASHDFQEALKNYRDLLFLQGRLAQWRDDAAILDDIVTARRAAFHERLPRVRAAERTRQYDRLIATRNDFAATLERIAREGDAAGLASEKERAIAERLTRATQHLTRSQSADPEMADRLRLLKGLLQWDQEAEFKPRLREAQRALAELDEELAQVTYRRESLERAQGEAPRQFADYERRIAALRATIDAQQARARALIVQQQAYLGELAVAELAQQRERIATYLTQARFAVAQIYDQSAAQQPERP